ncbi:MAG: head-tail adaptor protein [Rickettsiaceae bacterium]|nr:head-tail adaptor protein [Rickettsiaceae bacterium]
MKATKTLSSNFRHFIEFIQQEADGMRSWRMLCAGFAEITSLSEANLKEYDDIKFGHLLQEEYFLITTRYVKTINDQMRIRFRDRTFIIRKIINPYQLNHILKIVAQEIVGGS